MFNKILKFQLLLIQLLILISFNLNANRSYTSCTKSIEDSNLTFLDATTEGCNDILQSPNNCIQNGSTFYVSSFGNDNNDGLTPTTAWKTLNKVNNITFGAGNAIVFNGENTFKGSLRLNFSDGGDTQTPLTISSYGN